MNDVLLQFLAKQARPLRFVSNVNYHHYHHRVQSLQMIKHQQHFNHKVHQYFNHKVHQHNQKSEFTFICDVTNILLYLWLPAIFFISYSFKCRSYALRSKAKRKDPQSPTPPARQSKQTKINNNEAPAEKYRTLTKKVGKIPKKKLS